jgi:hypothetical protein
VEKFRSIIFCIDVFAVSALGGCPHIISAGIFILADALVIICNILLFGWQVLSSSGT